MKSYIQFQLAQIAQTEDGRPPLVAFLAFVWSQLNQHFNGFALSNPVFWVSIFWAMDWVLGSINAFRSRQWSPRRSFYGVIKWFIWMCVLSVAWGVRSSNFLGCSFIAACIEVAILLTEGTSVLRNCAELSDNKRAKRLLNRFADATEKKLEQLEERLAVTERATAELQAPPDLLHKENQTA